MQDLQPTQSEGSTKTMPSFARFCIAPVRQASTHEGVSQWKQGTKRNIMRGTPEISCGPTGTMRESLGPTERLFLVLQCTSHA